MSRRGVLVVGATALVAVALTTVWVARDGGDPSAPQATPCTPDPRATAPPTTTTPTPTPVRPEADPARGTPVRLRIPSLDVDAAVVPVEPDAEGNLDPPPLVKQVGWWSGGAEPGASRGTVVCTGHTVHAGGGVFDDLGSIEVGALIRVTTERGTVDYAVTDVREVSKRDFPDVAEELFDQAVPARLDLVTCSRYRLGRYRANTVVIAEPTGRSARYAG